MDGVAAACELYREGFWGQRANSVTSLAFIAAAVVIAVQGIRRSATSEQRYVYAVLVAAVGVGSLIEHGPNPQWQTFAHDLPMAAIFAFVAADAAGDLLERRLAAWWWLVPTAFMVPIVAWVSWPRLLRRSPSP